MKRRDLERHLRAQGAGRSMRAATTQDGPARGASDQSSRAIVTPTNGLARRICRPDAPLCDFALPTRTATRALQAEIGIV